MASRRQRRAMGAPSPLFPEPRPPLAGPGRRSLLPGFTPGMLLGGSGGGGGGEPSIPVAIKQGSAIVANGTGVEFDLFIREIGNVLHDPTDTGEEYKVVYTGHDDDPYVGTDTNIGYAHSSDGVTWTKGGQLTLGRAAEDPHLLKSGSTYYLYVEDKADSPYRNIRLFTSTDFLTWTDQGDVLDIGVDAWEARDVSSPVVWIEGSTWHMLYEGRSTASGAPGLIGHATSSDGLTWTKDASNPVVTLTHVPWAVSIVPDDIKKVGSTYMLLGHGQVAPLGTGTWYPFVITSTNLTDWSVSDAPLGGFFDADTSAMFHPATDTYVYSYDNDIYQAEAITTYGSTLMATTRVALNTITGRQTITIPGFGVPKAVMFELTRASADGTVTDHLNGSVGAAAKASQWVSGFASDSGSALSNTRRWWSSGGVARLYSGSGTLLASAGFVNFVEDGVEIDNFTAPGLGHFLTATLLGTEALQAYCGNVAGPNASTVSVPVGFAPSAALLVNSNLATSTDDIHAHNSFGMLSWDGATLRQANYTYRNLDAEATMNVPGQVRNDAVKNVPVNPDDIVTAGNVTSSGFDLTATNNHSGIFGVLALGGIDAWVGVVDSPITTGNADLGSAPFTPSAAMMMPTMLSAVNTVNAAGEGGAFGISTFDGTREYCNAWADEDAAATSNTQSVSDDQAVNLDTHAGAAAFDATFGSWIAGGARLNFTAANGTARKWLAMFVKESA